jgi:uncharacterized protein
MNDGLLAVPKPQAGACDEAPPPRLLEGIAQFNRGEFFEQHETLELLWRDEPRPIRRLYQGILQIGVAFYHLQRRNYHGVVYMLTRGSMYLAPFAPACQTIDVQHLLDDAAAALRAIEHLGPNGLERFDRVLVPKIRVGSPRDPADRGGIAQGDPGD